MLEIKWPYEGEAEKKAIRYLREFGCKCPDPLLGERPGVGPRCRLCNTLAILPGGKQCSKQ